jgi:hypothetical protein
VLIWAGGPHLLDFEAASMKKPPNVIFIDIYALQARRPFLK